MFRPIHIPKAIGLTLTYLCGLLVLSSGAAQAVPAPFAIKSAVYSKKTSMLTVKTRKDTSSGTLALVHGNGGVLDQTGDAEHTFVIPLSKLGEVPCTVDARVGDLKFVKPVKGATGDCRRLPVCKIMEPNLKSMPKAGEPMHFRAKALLRDNTAKPLRYEWDFAGGVMGQPSGVLPRNGRSEGDVVFVRDNSRYRVRFAAMDAAGRRCESSIDVIVGKPPAQPSEIAMLSGSSVAAAPARSGALSKGRGEKVVLPYQDWTMQTATDARTVPDVYVVYGPQVNNINAVVYEKGRQPPVVNQETVELFYSAATNAADPVGGDSINSTSQNWPVGASVLEAEIAKGDLFQTPGDPLSSSMNQSYSYFGYLTPDLPSAPDEGYHSNQLNPPLNPEHGLHMPGVAAPYQANEAQPFSEFVSDENRFAARMLPVTDVDDSGRINPTPLFRIEAREPGTEGPVAATDLVVSSGRDLHCRECHMKGKIGANLNWPRSPRRALNYYDAEGDTIADQEYAAIRNIANLHQIGSGCGDTLYTWMEHTDAVDQSGNPAAFTAGPRNCNSSTCHTTAISRTPYSQPLKMASDVSGMGAMGRPLSDDVHRLHGQLQYKDDSKTDVVRLGSGPNGGGQAKRFDPAVNWDPATGSMPNGLFPVKDSKGNILPMEENCLKCHGGMRERCYRDRMYTAGVTCYQCHGDMLAVSNSFKKSTPGADGNFYRLPWLDEPDCASCHTGNGNRGRTGADGYFSAGVMRTAFDEKDPAATPRQPDRFNPDEVRFAVPVSAMNIGDAEYKPDGTLVPLTTKTPLFRAGKDSHGQVPCAACHGAAHAIWPNRDPNANDNVTSLQLQGHVGPIAECGVCHTADAFAKFADLDEGLKASDPQTGVLGGPHNMHPVNDPNWWKSAEADTAPNEGSRKINGGWHNDYAKLPGRAGEDQCAACHGNDHRGTRLSKTPVDRQFIDEKGKKVSVKAGTAIGCDLCHSIEKSCTRSPALPNCGKSSERVADTTNLPPVIHSQPANRMVLGEEFRYAVDASDPEGEELSYELVRSLWGYNVTIDSQTGLITYPAEKIQELASNLYDKSLPTVLFDYQVMVYDRKGARSVQSGQVTVDCPDGLVWDSPTHACVKITFTSQSPMGGLNTEQPYDYQVVARQRSGEPLTYSLTNQPKDMLINPDTGLIKWMVPADFRGQADFLITAANQQGDIAEQSISLTICAPPLHWDAASGTCLGPVNFISNPTIPGLNAGETYTYQAKATQHGKLPLSYSLVTAPEGMKVDVKTGLITWVAQAAASGPVPFTVKARDTETGSAVQEVSVMVCVDPEAIDLSSKSWCMQPIEFTSWPPEGVDAGQTYSHQATATHKKLDRLPLSFSLVGQPDGMNIDPATGAISWTARELPEGSVVFQIVATDSKGYSVKQEVGLTVCPAGTNWSETLGFCRGDVRITSTQPTLGLNVGETFTYQVTATDANPEGLPITYTLADAPLGLNIDSTTGLINWVAVSEYTGSFNFSVVATDRLGNSETQYGALSICVPPNHWSTEAQGCQ
jgi:hypothetical protein